jgi:Raf kinase inhibitor-like YbhB/YbcL family protein
MMKDAMKRGAAPALILAAALWVGMTAAQAQQPAAGGRAGAPAGGARGGGRGPVLSVTTNAFPDGGEVPMHNAGRGDNKSPAFEFHWMNGTAPASAPDTVKTYALVMHDIENATARGTTDTLHWTLFNIPGTATGIPEGLGPGVLPDGTTNGPGIAARGGNPGAYFGPGAGPGPFHHYVFEFYALDTKLDIPATATRDELMKAMEGHVVGKAAYVGRFHGMP